ncbi:MAG: HAD-IIIA family hydrolase [Patescibacteria group bacterium]
MREELGRLREKYNINAWFATPRLLINSKSAKPDLVLENINGLSPQNIKKHFDLIIFDLDGTLVDEASSTVSEKITETFAAIQEKGEVAIEFLTNKSENRNREFERNYDVKVTDGIVKKPSPKGYEKILTGYPDINRSRVLFVGDTLFSDVYGAKKLGLKTALVNYKSIYSQSGDKLSTKQKFGRPLDRFLLRRIFGKNAPLQN